MGEDETCVRVAVRIRPQTPREVIEMCRICTSVTPGEPQITLSSDRSFTYDYVFDMGCEQEEVYNTCVKKLVEGALEGYNATVLAYGQTGSGKTYTMGTGFEVEVQEHQTGILPRAIKHLFTGMKERIQNARQNGEPSPDFKIDAQFMELYNDDIIDLLDPTQGYLTRLKGIKIHEDHSGGIYVKGITQQNVSSVGEALNLLRQGALSRTTGATQMNSQSSRSHAIFTLLIKQQKLVKIEDDDPENEGKNEFATLSAKFHFVDLAGSERLKRTQATGDRAREGIFINGGLLALGNVISALGDKTKKALHVPYRDSKLTRLLQDSLGGNSQTVMIACVSPSDSDFMETLNTLNYANRARNIKNKVIINQDKSSRTIALLKERIQELQLELLEYKQGKRLVREDGVEVVNDMCHENMLLQTEANNLRARLKAMQETIDALTKKNSQLLAEKASSVWANAGEGSSDVGEMVAQYLKEIQELQAKLLESEALCQQLRKSSSRQQAIVLSPTRLLKTSRERFLTKNPLTESFLMRRAKSFNELPSEPKNFLFQYDYSSAGSSSSDLDHNFSFTSNLIAEAKMDLSKDIELLNRREKKEKNGNEESIKNGAGSDLSDTEDKSNNSEDSSSDSSDEEDRESQYGLELVELTTEISMKQKLIEELERSQQKLHSMKQHYEEKLLQLQEKIRATQDERDKVLASVVGQQNQPDKVRKIRDDYERKVNEMQKEMRRLETAQKQHTKLLREQNQQSSQLRSLKAEVEEMKRTKVTLMKKMKEEAQKHKQIEMQRTREIAMLRKESRRHENQIRSLQAENRVKEAVLRRRNEEVTALRTRTKGIMSKKAAGRVVKPNHKEFSPKAAKNKWTAIEKTINKLKINKKAMALTEKDMERLMNEREVLGKELEELIAKRDFLISTGNCDSNDVRDLEEQIEAGQANMNYIQETISECQHNIIEMEDCKTEVDLMNLQSINTIEEGRYLIEKLYSLIIAQAVSTVRSEINLENLNARVQQLSTDNDTQNQLLQHLISSHQLGIDLETLRPPPSTSRSCSENSSTASSRSSSPSTSPLPRIDRGLRRKKSNLSSDSLKHRRRTALPKDLLYVLENKDSNEEESNRATKPPSLQTGTVSGSSRAAAVKPSESPNRKIHSEISSPRPLRRIVNLSNTKIDKESSGSPPGSPTTYRRTNSREENVFSRLTGGTAGPELQAGRGIISQFEGKVNLKAPLGCAYVASGHTRAVLSVDATDDLLFTASKDRSVKVWDLNSGVELQSLAGHPNNVEVVKYCESYKTLYSVSSSYVKVWDMRMSPSRCVKTLCSSGLTVNGPLALTTQSRTLTVPQGETQITDVALSRCGTVLYMAAGDRVRVWDLRKFASMGKLAGGHQAAVMCLAVAKLSEKEDVVVTGSKDHYIKVFEVNKESGGVFSPKLNLNPPHYDGIQSLALHGDVLFSGSRDMCIKKWDLARQELIQSINNAHSNWICGLVLMPGGQQLVSGCRSGVLKVWSVESCSLIGEVRAHNSPVNAVAVNSAHLFTASNTGEVKIWRPNQSISRMSMSTGKIYQLTL